MNKRTKRAEAVAAALCVVTSVVSALGALGNVSASTVRFEAKGPAGLKIEGSSGGVQVSEADGKVKLTSPTTELHTGIGLRDRHLRDHLETEQHPLATLVVERSRLSFPLGSGASQGSVAATLTLHGVTKPVQVGYRIQHAGSGYHVEGSFDVNITLHGIKKPCYLGVCVGDVVKVTAELDVSGS
jgi:polyisoprenoid-binding protein YceI